jgi:hypothetical protein
MLTAAETRAKADSSLALAASITDPEVALHWRTIGEAWRGLAISIARRDALATWLRNAQTD